MKQQADKAEDFYEVDEHKRETSLMITGKLKKRRYAVKVRDKNVKQMVDVSDKECPKRECYWPRPDPGVFTQGVGYRTRYPGCKSDWLCGNREIRGCPEKYCHTPNTKAYLPKCLVCE